MDQWGLILSQNLVEVEGRILPQENIHFGNEKIFPSGPEVNWTNQVKTNALFHPAKLEAWVIIFPKALNGDAKNLYQMIQKCGRNMRFQIPNAVP